MKIAVSATGENLDATIDERFGRCQYFIFVDTNNMSYEAVANDNSALSGSAGIQSAAFVASKGVEAVLTGNCGPKAMQVFGETNIRVILNQQGTVRDAVEVYKKGGLSPATEGNVPEKSGVASNPSAQGSGQPGMGMGGGRGMGGGGRGMGGCGRGMGGGGRGMGGGGGMGMGRRFATPSTPAPNTNSVQAAGLNKEQEIEQLQQQSEMLKKQMEDIQNRLKDLS